MIDYFTDTQIQRTPYEELATFYQYVHRLVSGADQAIENILSELSKIG